MIKYTDFDEIFKAVDRAADALIADFYAAYTEAKKAEKKKAVEKPKTNLDKKVTNTSKKNVKLSPPWTTVEKKIRALFNGDEDITIKPIKRLADGNLELSLEGPDACKMIALSSIMKTKYNFGNFNLNLVFRTTDGKEVGPIEVDEWFDDLYGVYEDAFCSTATVIDIKDVQDRTGAENVVISFKKEVVQFFNDDLTDFYGNWNGLYTDIAKELLNDNLFVKYTIAEK